MTAAITTQDDRINGTNDSFVINRDENITTNTSSNVNEKSIIPVKSEYKDKDAYILESGSENQPKSLYKRYGTKALLILFWLLVTAYYVASIVLHPEDPSVRSVLYCFITLKVFFEFVPTTIVTLPVSRAWKPIYRLINRLNTPLKYILGCGATVTIVVVVTFCSPVTPNGSLLQRGQSLLGMCIFLILMYVTSRNRRLINWRTVTVGILLQFLLGIIVIKTKFGYDLFTWLSLQCAALLGFAKEGSAFIFGEYAKLSIFAFTVLPGVLFFAALVQIVYYTGAMQWVLVKFAWFFKTLMDTSGSESVVASASPFVGQGESALLVKPFLPDMTKAELHQVMASGFATIGGSVLIAFISFDIDPRALITSCVMSIPCSLALSKMRVPETEVSKTKGIVVVPENEEKESNVLHAAANGAAQGVTLVLLIAGTLLAIISLLALVNALLTWWGSFINIEKLTLELIMGYIFVPFAWLVGIPGNECYEVGQLMATKMFVNEFAAFIELAKPRLQSILSERSKLLATYSLCGFANLASIGIQVGCLGAMAPSRKEDLAELAFSAMLTGTMSTFVSATVAGLLM